MRLQLAILSGWMVFFVGGLHLPAATLQSDHTSVIFRLGSFDHSSAEFAGGIPTKPVKFIVGQSAPAENWYATQSAESISIAPIHNTSGATAPRSIQFQIAGAPGTAYRLHVSLLLIESAGLPALRVSINDKHGIFYLRPKPDYGIGDEPDADIESDATVSFRFPGSYLRQGTNTITLQMIDETAKNASRISLRYDAIELDSEVEGHLLGGASAEILPTVFYRRVQGRLDEIVDVIICSSKSMGLGSDVDLVIAGKHYREEYREDQDFGEHKFEFMVPEFSIHTRARLTWKVLNHTLQKEEVITPKKKWTIFLVPHIHLDVGYTDYQAKVAAIQSRVIDEAMGLTAQHPDFRFSLDGEWPLEQFLKTRTPAEQQRAITAIQKQHLFIPAQYANLLTGFPTAETMIRSLYDSANFSREHGTPFNYANITDVPSYSWSYASVLAAAGIKYFLAGSDNDRAPVLVQGYLNERSPFWWEGPDGKKVLLWYARGYAQMGVIFGRAASLSQGQGMLPLFLQEYERPSYRASAVVLFGSQLENTDLFPQQAGLAQMWNDVYAYPRLQYSGIHKALETIARQFGNDIPTVRGDGGPYWEIGIASDAYYAAMEHENESRGPTAEKLATLTSLVNPHLAADKIDLDRMWADMVLMDEHTWDSGNSVSEPTSREAVQQLAVKNLYAVKAHALADVVVRNSMASLAGSISAGRGSLIVFNTLNWARSGLVSLDLNKEDEILDMSSGRIVPVEVLSNGRNFRHVRFVASDVPAVGYKVYLLRRTKKTIVSAETTRTTVLESPYYRVTLDASTGAVRSIYDKSLRRELVNQESPYRFSEYFYVTGGDQGPNSILRPKFLAANSSSVPTTCSDQQSNNALRYHLALPQPQLQIHPATNGHLISVMRTPYGWVARMESADINTPKIKTEIQLFDQEKKIEITEDVTKKDVDTKEGVYFAFPFSMDHPHFQYEIQNGVVDPAKDMLPGAGHEWFSVQHWVSVQQNGVSATVMPLDASLVTLGDINRGAWPDRFGQRPGTIFSYVMNNYYDTNYRAGQGGHFRFRYVITSAPSTNAVALSRLGWEEMTPLEKDKVTSQDKALNLPCPLDGKQSSFLKINDADLLLETWKPAEDGNGTILRFLDLGGTVRAVTIQTPLLHLKQAWQTDAVERNEKPLSLVRTKGVQFTIHPHELVTVRIVGKDAMLAPALEK